VPVYPQRPAPDTNSSPVTEAIAAVKTATAAAGAATAAAGAASQVAGALGLTGATTTAAAPAAEAAAAGAAGAGGSAAAVAAAPLAIAAFVVWNAGELLFGGPEYGTPVPAPYADNDGGAIDRGSFYAVTFNDPRWQGNPYASKGGWVYIPKAALDYDVASVEKTQGGAVTYWHFPNGIVIGEGPAGNSLEATGTPGAIAGAIYVPAPPDPIDDPGGGASSGWTWDSSSQQWVLARPDYGAIT